MADTTPSIVHRLKAFTNARIALGRAGSSLPTKALLEFDLSHARARDAVHAALPDDFAAKLDALEVKSQAEDRVTYLQRPDLGRRLDPADAGKLKPQGKDELLIVLADGLSATAVEAHGPAVLEALRERLKGWTFAQPVVARQARVALGDEIGERIGAAAVIVLIGERPGLSSPASLGAYITWAPRVGRLDGERNCVSNIWTPGGATYEQAADRIALVLNSARDAKLTGVKLKLPFDDGTPALEHGG
jgi:ethanolamine ammonia-lyase small subunit